MKVLTSLLTFVIITTPLVTSAQGLVTSLVNIGAFVYDTLIPFLLGIAFLIVVINIVRYFVIDAANEQSRSDARMYAIYAVAAFVCLALFWAVVSLVALDIGLDADTPTPDYFEVS